MRVAVGLVLCLLSLAGLAPVATASSEEAWPGEPIDKPPSHDVGCFDDGSE